MSTGKVVNPVVSLTQDRVREVHSLTPAKRKFNSSQFIFDEDEFDYPSPPMSNPSSPPQTAPEQLGATTSGARSFIPAGAIAPPPGFGNQPPAPPSVQQPSKLLPPPPAGQLFSIPPPTSYGAPYPTSAFGAVQGQQATPTGAIASSSVSPTMSRPARKSKSHVASACINCKRAHLSCDVNRPCARCVASGKQVKTLTKLREVCRCADQYRRIRVSMSNTKNAADLD